MCSLKILFSRIIFNQGEKCVISFPTSLASGLLPAQRRGPKNIHTVTPIRMNCWRWYRKFFSRQKSKKDPEHSRPWARGAADQAFDELPQHLTSHLGHHSSSTSSILRYALPIIKLLSNQLHLIVVLWPYTTAASSWSCALTRIF